MTKQKLIEAGGLYYGSVCSGATYTTTITGLFCY